jgi:hypothetical protein
MTLIAKCLDAKVEAGELTRKQAEGFLRDLDNTIDRNTTAGGGDMDHARVVRVAQAKRAAAEKLRQQAALTVTTQHRALENAGSHKKGFTAGVQALLARDWFNSAGYSNVEARIKVVRGELHAMFESGLDRLRPKGVLQRQDELALERFVRELYGEGTGDKEASGAAQAWASTADHAVQRFNNAGGAITRKEDWRLPQVFDGRRVKAAGQERFRETMLAAFNDGSLRIRDFDTGEAVSPLRAVEIIDQAWASISTDGLADMVPGQRGQGRKVANRHNLPRAFEWTSADAWLRFNDTFGAGRGGIFDLLTGHIEGMSRDIGLVEVMGPNPDATFRLLQDTARKRGATAGQADRLGHLYDTVTGRAFSPVNEAWAEGMAGVRAWLTASQLGSALLSSVTDFATMRQTARWNGLDASKIMSRYVGTLASEGDRKLAVRTGLIADGWITRGLAANRDQGEVLGSGLAQRMAEFTMRASGLQQHTAAGRWAFGMEFKAHLADLADTAWAKLPPETQRGFAGYGITRADWDLVRAHGVADFDGVRLFDPRTLARSEQPGAFDAANRVQEMILSEMDYAIPTPGARERALLLQGTRPGTFTGELLRSFVQYKTFPVTMMTMHLMRGYQNIGADRGAYLVQMALSTTIMGALAMQMKEVAKGKDARDMEDWKFWGAAFVQGGGAGLFGDFLYSGVSRADRGLMSAVAGPTWGLAEDAYKLTLGNIGQAAADKDTNFGRELARFVRSNTPGSSIWYGRLALDRLLWDRLQQMVDPDAAGAFGRLERRARRETGQDYWWSPGDTQPARAPALLETEAP